MFDVLGIGDDGAIRVLQSVSPQVQHFMNNVHALPQW